MIRQDYIIRMIRELVQVLARIVLLKEKSQFGEALQELEAVLVKLRGVPLSDPPHLDAESIFAGVQRFAAERPKRLEQQRSLLDALK
jgi:hypothetical protein